MKCKYCNKEFKLTRKLTSCKNYKGYYCSVACYHNHRWQAKGKCKNCGKKTKQPVYCSAQCRQDYWNRHDYWLIKKKRIWERRFELIKKLGGKCRECGNKDMRVLDINHIDRKKKTRPKDGHYNWSRRFKEWYANLDNLELLCANCHRIHTWKQMQYQTKTTTR